MIYNCCCTLFLKIYWFLKLVAAPFFLDMIELQNEDTVFYRSVYDCYLAEFFNLNRNICQIEAASRRLIVGHNLDTKSNLFAAN